MRLIFLEFTTTENELLHVNLNNIIYTKKIDDNTTKMVCVGGIEFTLSESYTEVSEGIDRAVELSEPDLD